MFSSKVKSQTFFVDKETKTLVLYTCKQKEVIEMNLNLNSYDIPEKLRIWMDKQEKHQSRHVGTHIDVYKLSKLEDAPEMCLGRVVDVRGEKNIDVKSLKDIPLDGVKFIVFRTGYMEEYGYASDKYFNLDGAPVVTRELIDILAAKKLRFVGIDLHGIQHGKDHVSIDRYCEAKGIYVIENITNLNKVEELLRVKLEWNQMEGATAIPVRIETADIK